MKKAIWTFVFTTIALAIILICVSIFRPMTQPITNDTADSISTEESLGFGETPSFQTPDDSFFTAPDGDISMDQEKTITTDADASREQFGTADDLEGAEALNEPGTTGSQSVFVARGCQVTGCSGTICANTGEDINSTCEWREEYTCYKDPKNECVQDDQGQCGWVMTSELQMCIENNTKLLDTTLGDQ